MTCGLKSIILAWLAEVRNV